MGWSSRIWTRILSWKWSHAKTWDSSWTFLLGYLPIQLFTYYNCNYTGNTWHYIIVFLWTRDSWPPDHPNRPLSKVLIPIPTASWPNCVDGPFFSSPDDACLTHHQKEGEYQVHFETQELHFHVTNHVLFKSCHSNYPPGNFTSHSLLPNQHMFVCRLSFRTSLPLCWWWEYVGRGRFPGGFPQTFHRPPPHPWQLSDEADRQPLRHRGHKVETSHPGAKKIPTEPGSWKTTISFIRITLLQNWRKNPQSLEKRGKNLSDLNLRRGKQGWGFRWNNICRVLQLRNWGPR